MTQKPFEEDDPLELVAVGPFATAEDCLEEMARTFIDEYARLGWNRERLLALFRDPFYQGPHAIYQAKGEARIQQLIAERVPERRLPAPLVDNCQDRLVCDACPAPIASMSNRRSAFVSLARRSHRWRGGLTDWGGACPVGGSLGNTQCPIRRTKRRLIEWLKARFLGRRR